MPERPERRRADRATWPWKDRVWWWVVKVGRGIRVRAVSLFIVLLIALIGVTIFQQQRSDTRDSNRDEARKYQACLQRADSVKRQNGLSRALRDALASSIKQRGEQADRTSDNAIRRGLLSNASDLARSRAGVTFAPIPDCRRTYPRGFEHTDDFPDLAPAQPPPARPTGGGR